MFLLVKYKYVTTEHNVVIPKLIKSPLEIIIITYDCDAYTFIY